MVLLSAPSSLLISPLNYTTYIGTRSFPSEAAPLLSIERVAHQPLHTVERGRAVDRFSASIVPYCAPPSSTLLQLVSIMPTTTHNAPRPGIQRTRHLRGKRQSARVSLRASTSPFRLPGLMEKISVLWVLHGSPVWWEAEVTDIASQDSASDQEHSATEHALSATILYEPRGDYPSEEYVVRFSPTSEKKTMKTLHHANPAVPGLVAWKFSDEKVDIHDRLTASQRKCCRQEKGKVQAKKSPGVQAEQLYASNSHPEETPQHSDSVTGPTTSALNITEPQVVLERYVREVISSIHWCSTILLHVYIQFF